MSNASKVAPAAAAASANVASTAGLKPAAEISASIGKALEELRASQNVAPRTKLDSLDKLCALRRHMVQPTVASYCSLQALVDAIRPLTCDPLTAIRAAALRTYRYFTREPALIQELLNQRVALFIGRSLERDAKHEIERMQALKLIRRMIEVEASLMPRSIMSAIVAIASNSEDNFSRACLETLCEITLRNPRVVALSGGLKVIMLAVVDPSFSDIVEPLVLTLVSILNQPETRQYLRDSVDFGVIVSPLTDTYVQSDADINDRRECSKLAMLALLRCWPGLIFLTSTDNVGLKAFVHSLELNVKEITQAVLSSIFELFSLPNCTLEDAADWNRALHRQSDTLKTSLQSGELLLKRGERYSLVNCYLSAVLIALVQADLVTVLVDLGIGADKRVGVQATILLGEILHLSNRILPNYECASLQALPSLVASAASFKANPDDPGMRARANALIGNLHEFARAKKLAAEFQDFHIQLLMDRTNMSRRERGTDLQGRNNNVLGALKMKMETQMDEAAVQQMLRDSNVLMTKEYQQWNWDIISELLNGALQEKDRLVDVMQKTKFVKRILSFLRPNREQFSKLKYSKGNIRYVRVACQLLEMLVQSDEGVAYLQENELFQQIAEFCTNEAANTTPAGTERVLTKENMQHSMAREYFTMLGTLSRSRNGQQVLEFFKLFKTLYPLTELTGREDLSHLIVSNLDYNSDGHARILLAKTMTSKKSKEIRYRATSFMRVLLRAGVSDFKDWGTDLLVTQLADQDEETAALALSILNESCDDMEILTTLISKKPKLQDLGNPGKELMMRFLSCPEGYTYLSQGSTWIADQLAVWLDKGNVAYVTALETALAKAMNPFLYKQRANDDADETRTVALPTHLYGELAKTREGCENLKRTGHVPIFARTIRNPPDTTALKSALWAVGHIGATQNGFALIDAEGLLPLIVDLAVQSSLLSLRGTAFYVIGLISCTEQGSAALRNLGWESMGKNGICVPLDPLRLFTIPTYNYTGSWPSSDLAQGPLSTTEVIPNINDYPPEDATNLNEILKLMGNLSNHISADAASRSLKKLKRSDPNLFLEPGLYARVMQLLCIYKFRPPARKFMHELFETIDLTIPAALQVIDRADFLAAVVAPLTGVAAPLVPTNVSFESAPDTPENGYMTIKRQRKNKTKAGSGSDSDSETPSTSRRKDASASAAAAPTGDVTIVVPNQQQVAASVPANSAVAQRQQNNDDSSDEDVKKKKKPAAKAPATPTTPKAAATAPTTPAPATPTAAKASPATPAKPAATAASPGAVAASVPKSTTPIGKAPPPRSNSMTPTRSATAPPPGPAPTPPSGDSGTTAPTTPTGSTAAASPSTPTAGAAAGNGEATPAQPKAAGFAALSKVVASSSVPKTSPLAPATAAKPAVPPRRNTMQTGK